MIVPHALCMTDILRGVEKMIPYMEVGNENQLLEERVCYLSGEGRAYCALTTSRYGHPCKILRVASS